jgi:hypothetical protein
MDEQLLRDLYVARGAAEDEIAQALAAVALLEANLMKLGIPIGKATVDDLRAYVDALVSEGPVDRSDLLALARFFYANKSYDIYIYFTQLFGSRGVMENISSRLADAQGPEVAQRILGDFSPPALGTPLTEMPAHTADFMQRLQDSLSPEQCRDVLTGNNHGIREEGFREERSLYLASSTLDQYLREYHQRGVAELEDHCAEGKIWYEQVITQDVVDFVRGDQEILSAVRAGDKIYTTKIPYDTVRLLTERDPARRRYHVCHCPFVREALLSGELPVDGNWCYCSAGFVKFPFEVIFGTTLGIELLESPLLGHDRCRFAITLPDDLPVK